MFVHSGTQVPEFINDLVLHYVTKLNNEHLENQFR